VELVRLVLFAGMQVAVAQLQTGAQPREPREVALEYLRSHRAEVGLSEEDLADVIAIGQNVVRSSGVTNVHLRQRYHGVGIIGAEMNVIVTSDGRVLNTGGSFIKGLAGAVNEPQRRISAVDAARAAASSLGLVLREPFKVLQEQSGASAKTTLSPGGIASESIPAHLAYQRVAPARARLAWVLEIERPDGRHWWVMTIDAENGDVLDKSDRVLEGGSPS
jgi:Zn-dependent metalloprotease